MEMCLLQEGSSTGPRWLVLSCMTPQPGASPPRVACPASAIFTLRHYLTMATCSLWEGFRHQQLLKVWLAVSYITRQRGASPLLAALLVLAASTPRRY